MSQLNSDSRSSGALQQSAACSCTFNRNVNLRVTGDIAVEAVNQLSVPQTVEEAGPSCDAGGSGGDAECGTNQRAAVDDEQDSEVCPSSEGSFESAAATNRVLDRSRLRISMRVNFEMRMLVSMRIIYTALALATASIAFPLSQLNSDSR